ncbi:MAG: cyclic nucleotide-binding domain-containing protein [Thermoanaerobaculia bacterium]
MDSFEFHLAIIGAGPAGLSAAAQARENGLRCVVLERSDHLGDTIHCYQKQKLVMAEPALVPLRSDLPFAAGSREDVLERWQRFVAERQVEVRFGQEVVAVERGDGGFSLRTRGGGEAEGREIRAERVIVALGTQGNPRRLGVPGDDLSHVAYRLVDPETHDDEDIVVVGAGDSALEVALALADRNRVHLVVRTPEIYRAKERLEREILARQATGQAQIHFSSTIRKVEPGAVEIDGPEGEFRVAAQRIFVKIGATPPRQLLESWGIEFVGDGRDARPLLRSGFESSIPRLHLIGAVTGRDLIKLSINQGYEVVQYMLGNEIDPADEEILRARLPYWQGKVGERLETLREAIPLLQGADESQLREIFLLAQIKEYRDGDVILRQNDYTDSFLVITDGRVAITRRGEDGGEEMAVELSAGNFFGEMGLISGRRRSASATAKGPCRLIEIPRKAMLKLLHIAPEVRKIIDWTFLIRALQSYMFPGVPDASLWQIAAQAKVERFERNQEVFKEGEIGDALYLIRSGMVKLSRQSGDREIVLTYLVAGNHFGESALLADSPRSATVTAIFPSDLIVLDKASFTRFFDHQPDLRRKFLESLERKNLVSLASEAAPDVGAVLSHLIEAEAVIGTDVLVIDNHKCVRCGNCVAACEGVHDDGQARLSLTGNQVANLLLPNSCMQCENPLCMLDCPPDAIVRRQGGEIHIKDSCIGCGNCAANCPYDNVFMVHPKGEGSFAWLTKLFRKPRAAVAQEVAVKCDLCRDLHSGPACVSSCPTGAAIRLEPESPADLQRSIENLIDLGPLG